jgi:hypothetical protein
MQAMVLLLIAVASLGFIAWRKPADKAVNQHPSGRWFVWAGMLVLALYAAFYLLFFFGEVFGGEPSGVIHLPPALLVIALIYLAYRRPRESGTMLTGLGVLAAAFYLFRGNWSTALLIAAPILGAGLLFLAAMWWSGWKRAI